MVATSLRDIPVEIEEAARIDGCSDFRILLDIILPIAAPGIVTAGIFAFVLSWQEYIFALLYTTTERAQTAPVLLFYLLGQHQIDYARLMAAAVLLSIPIAVPFAIIQRVLSQRDDRRRRSKADRHADPRLHPRAAGCTGPVPGGDARLRCGPGRPASFDGVALVGSGSSFNALTVARPRFVAARRGPVLVYEPRGLRGRAARP